MSVEYPGWREELSCTIVRYDVQQQRIGAGCGGAGNIVSVLRALRELGHAEHPWTYATPQETLARLSAAGFVDARARLVPRPAPLAPDEVERYLATVVLGPYLDRLGPEAGHRLVHEVAVRLPRPEIDCVRLQVTARRAG